jgi:U2 small nuclear ribonucleoprotein A'
VTKQPSYRVFVIARLPNLRALDFQRVSAKERATAEKIFGAASAAAAAAAAAAAPAASAGKAGPAAGGARTGPSPDQIALIKQARRRRGGEIGSFSMGGV